MLWTLELIKDGVVEIGIIRTPINQDIFEYINLPDEPMVAGVLSDLFWEDNIGYVDITELKGRPLMVHTGMLITLKKPA